MSQTDSPQAPSQPAASSTSPPPPPPRKSRAVACAECRRLKLKCDREFPCLNCRRREVANLCPNGSLVTRSRLSSTAIAEATQVKHDVVWMSERIKKLEEALALVQSKVSGEPHPLLSEPISEPTPGDEPKSPKQPEGSVSGDRRKPETDSADV